MSCCNNPDIQSSTYTDWCNNCGWAASYLDGYAEGCVEIDEDYYEEE